MYNYNPWKKFYKVPFGAVRNNESMTIRFQSDKNIQVKFIIHRDFGARHEFEMQAIDDKTYEVTITFDHGRALYFYHFELLENTDWGTRRLFYSASEVGGEGKVLEDEREVRDYQVTVYDGNDETADWYRDSVFYQIFPDRFYNGNEDGHVNSPKSESFLYAQESDSPFYIKDEKGEIARWDFYGGNLQGITKKISYLKELGVTALYLNPIFLSKSNHRYDTMNYLQIDPVLGTEEDFNAMVEALHANGMHLILDGVFSHVGDDSLYFNSQGTFGREEGAAKNQNSPYYGWFKFNHWPDDYKTWWGFKNMPEVDKNNPDYQNFIFGAENSVLTKWNNLGVDGWRLDVADELPDDFLRGIRKNLKQTGNHKVLIGEVWEDASNKISYEKRRNYILGDSLQGVMNYPLRDLIIHYVDGNIGAREVAYRLMTLRENYPKEIFYGNLNNLGTHDTERILSMVGDDNIALAVGLLFVMPGVPTIYYGDEAGLTGRKDPQNRKFFPWDAVHEPIYKIYQKWAKLRLENAALRRGNFNIGFFENSLVIIRHFNDETSLFIANPEEQPQQLLLGKIQMLRDQDFTVKLTGPGENIEVPAKSTWFGKI